MSTLNTPKIEELFDKITTLEAVRKFSMAVEEAINESKDISANTMYVILMFFAGECMRNIKEQAEQRIAIRGGKVS